MGKAFISSRSKLIANDKMKSLHDQIAKKCIHFNGLQHKKCRMGIVYDEIDKDKRIACRAALPCIKPDKYLPKGETQCHCPHVKFPTKEEVQAEIEAWDKEMKKITLGMKAVERIRDEYKGKNYSGVIECPVCLGRLHVSHAACNGHIHAKCETPGCIAWME